MKTIQRPQVKLIAERLVEPRKFIQVLFGPRQVGKTTAIAQALAQTNVPNRSITADNVDASNTRWLETEWNLARFRMEQENAPEMILVIDEIQKIDNWSEIVKKLWDDDSSLGRNIKVILSGSSRLFLQQGLTESLAGRFETIYMGHWTFPEMQEAFDWNAEQYAWFGGYPGPADLITNENRWKSYVANSLIETSISKDILMLTRVDKPALMKRLFELGSLYSGQVLSYTKIMGQLADAGNTTTLSNYLHLLNQAGLLGGLEKYSKDIIRKRSSSPKFQVHNTAFISSQHHLTFNQIRSQPELWGRIVESAIGAHLLNHSVIEGFKLTYWREGNLEVDFVIDNGRTTIGIEVKSGFGAPKRGMIEFQNKMNPKKVFFVGYEGLPWQDFLKLNPSILF